MFFGDMELSESSPFCNPYCLVFKVSLRMSFKVFIEKPSELHMLSAMQAMCKSCRTVCQINVDGGEVFSTVAAGCKKHSELNCCFDEHHSAIADSVNVLL